MPRGTLSRRDPVLGCEALMVTILPVEYAAVRDHLAGLRTEQHDGGNVYERGVFRRGERSLHVALAQIPKGGPGAHAVERAISHFDPRIVLLVGIAGSLKDDVQRGHVVAASKVYYHEAGKAEEEFLTRPHSRDSAARLVELAKVVSRERRWLKRIRGGIPSEKPASIVEPIVAGEVVLVSKKAPLFDLLRTRFNDAQAVEMEGYGFLDAAYANDHVLAMVIRGISDSMADKAQSDREGWQRTASCHASAFAFELLAKAMQSGTLERRPRVRGKPSNIPARDPFFVERDEAIRQIQKELGAGGRVALRGLPGVGKTQLALEFAHRSRDRYSAAFWCRADRREALNADYFSIATIVGLPTSEDADADATARSVRDWLERNHGWLLVLDNLDDLAVGRELLPASGGHVLLTSRLSAFGRIARSMEVTTLDSEQGARLLLRRAQLLTADAPLERASTAHVAAAKAISDKVGGLPLALDQAGSFIEARQVTPAEYLSLYDERGKELRETRGETAAAEHDSVAITFSIAFKELESASPSGAKVLRLSAFLAPDAIPEEIIHQSGIDLYGLSDAVAAAGRSSLLRRDASSRTLSLHRLVQDTLRDGLALDEQREWSTRSVTAVANAFPPFDNPSGNWAWVNRFLVQAVTAIKLIDQWEIKSCDAAKLLTNAGQRLWERAQYADAEHALVNAERLWEELEHPAGPNLATSLTNLAVLYATLGRYARAEALHLRALAIRQKALGPEHSAVASSLNNLAFVYFKQHRYADAQPLYKRCLEIREKIAPRSAMVAQIFNNLADLCLEMHRYEEAEKYYADAGALQRELIGVPGHGLDVGHPDLARTLNGLGWLRYSQGNHDEAEKLFAESLTTRESYLGRDHPRVSWSLAGLGVLYTRTGPYNKAEPLLRRALELRERALGVAHPDVADAVDDYARLLAKLRRGKEARQLSERAVEIRRAHAAGEESDQRSMMIPWADRPGKPARGSTDVPHLA